MDHEAGDDLYYNSEGEYNDDFSQTGEEDEMDNNDDHYSSDQEDEMDNNDAHVDNDAELDNIDAQLDNDNQVDNDAQLDNDAHVDNAPQANKRGLTRLVKWRAKFEKNGGEKWPLTFDALGRVGGVHRPKFSSFLGDIARSEVGLRYLQWKKVPKEDKNKMCSGIQQLFKIDDCRRGPIMVRLGGLLRSFRRKMFEKHIRPNLAKPTVLEKVLKMYQTIVKKEDWDRFVAYTKSDEFKVVSKIAKEVRAQYVYDHTMGRGGYVYMREKLVQNKEIAAENCPSRSFMWRKGRVNKEGEFKTHVVKGVADDIAENETKIKAGSVTVEPGTDALKLVLGKERGGYLKGIGYGVTSYGYWQGAPKGRSKERIEKLERELKNEKQLREKKDQEVEHLNDKLKAHDERINMLTAFMNRMIEEKQVDKAINSVKSTEAPLPTTIRSKNSCNQHSNVNTTGRKRKMTEAAAAAASTAGASEQEVGRKRKMTEAAAAAASTAGASEQEVEKNKRHAKPVKPAARKVPKSDRLKNQIIMMLL
ncbi:hypothetical protein SSX86_016512 [Deinandra increscens subsp. villosa]|uniref:Transposase n=1 Tax=Deinandra increscens subsp. villosa TaxID=3103831 RepID=A0AAP0GY53_9ASTR